MITTHEPKRDKAQIFTLESNGAPREVILMVGSCRSIAYLNYLARYNEGAGRPFRIHFIDPHDWHWDEFNNLVDIRDALEARETDPRNLAVIRSATVFLHEHYAGFGMFNTDRAQPKNIYQYGIAPRIDVCFPNFHNHFVLFQEQIEMNAGGIKGRLDRAQLSRTAQEDMRAYGLASVAKFCDVCRMSSFPEFADHFRMNWAHVRYFWTGNHVSSAFSLYLFRQLNDRFLNLPLTGDFWNAAGREDLFANPHTPVTKFDIDAYGLTWPGPVSELKLP